MYPHSRIYQLVEEAGAWRVFDVFDEFRWWYVQNSKVSIQPYQSTGGRSTDGIDLSRIDG